MESGLYHKSRRFQENIEKVIPIFHLMASVFISHHADLSIKTINPQMRIYGQFFFFSNLKNGVESIYWVNAKIIEEFQGVE